MLLHAFRQQRRQRQALGGAHSARQPLWKHCSRNQASLLILGSHQHHFNKLPKDGRKVCASGFRMFLRAPARLRVFLQQVEV